MPNLIYYIYLIPILLEVEVKVLYSRQTCTNWLGPSCTISRPWNQFQSKVNWYWWCSRVKRWQDVPRLHSKTQSELQFTVVSEC